MKPKSISLKTMNLFKSDKSELPSLARAYLQNSAETLGRILFPEMPFPSDGIEEFEQWQESKLAYELQMLFPSLTSSQRILVANTIRRMNQFEFYTRSPRTKEQPPRERAHLEDLTNYAENLYLETLGPLAEIPRDGLHKMQIEYLDYIATPPQVLFE